MSCSERGGTGLGGGAGVRDWIARRWCRIGI